MCSVVAKPLFHPHHQPCHCFKVNKLHLFKANKKSNNSSWQNNNIYHRRGNIKRFIGNTTTMATMMMRFQASMLRVSTNYTLNTLVTYLPCYAISKFSIRLIKCGGSFADFTVFYASKEAGP